MKLTNWSSSKIKWQAPDALPGGASPAPESAPAPADAGPDLSFIPADFHVDGKPDLTKFAEHYQETVAERARLAEQRVVPDAYDFALPPDLTFEGVPDGFDPGLDPSNPLFSELGNVLKELGAPAETAGKLTGLLAQFEAQKAAADFSAWSQDMLQLGSSGHEAKARADDVERKLQTLLPKEQVTALFSGPRISADGIRALEKLITGRSLQAALPGPSTPDLSGMTPAQKLDYANAQPARKRA
jgi:hypothetical protein